MKHTINGRKIGRVNFSAPGNGRIYVDLNGGEGKLGVRICGSGMLQGCALSFDGSQEDFGRICQKWYTSYLRVNDGAVREIAEAIALREKVDALRLRLDKWVKVGLSLYGDLDDQDDGSYAIHEMQDVIVNGLGRIIYAEE